MPPQPLGWQPWDEALPEATWPFQLQRLLGPWLSPSILLGLHLTDLPLGSRGDAWEWHSYS